MGKFAAFYDVMSVKQKSGAVEGLGGAPSISKHLRFYYLVPAFHILFFLLPSITTCLFLTTNCSTFVKP